MVEKQLAALTLDESPSQEIVRDKLIGHTASVNTIQLVRNITNLPDCLISASDDGTSRIWDLRTNKGAVLL